MPVHELDYNNRLIHQEQTLNTCVKPGEQDAWVLFSGNYSHERFSLYPKSPYLRFLETVSGAGGLESDIPRIAALMRKINPDKKIKIFDLGGGEGYTLTRLAAKSPDLFEIEINNFIYRPDVGTRIRHRHNGVNFTNGNWADLPGPDGKDCDIIIDNHSLSAWSSTPEDLMKIPQMLSSRGVYLRYDPEITVFPTYRLENPLATSEMRFRRTVLVNIYNEFIRNGLIHVTEVEEGTNKGKPLNYIVFRAPEAPPIS